MASDFLGPNDPDVSAVLGERRKQVGMGYDDANDANSVHADGELAMAACYMAWPTENLPEYDGHEHYSIGLLWPLGWDEDEHSYRTGKTRYEQLRVAGAFILAEMRRLRLQAEKGQSDAQG